MARFVMKLPDVGEGVVDAEVVGWQVKTGDKVSQDQPIAEVMTDKATVEMTAPVAGTVLETCGEPGERVAVGAEFLILEIEVGAESAGEDEPAEDASALPESVGQEAKSGPATVPGSSSSDEAPATGSGSIQSTPLSSARRPIAAPTVRRRAREAHIELTEVGGRGQGGRITHQDLDDYIARGHAQAVTELPGTISPAATPVYIEAEDGVEKIKLIGIRRLIAEKMTTSARRIPHFTYVEEVDVTELERLRLHLNARRQSDQAKLSYLPFIVKAMIKALRDYPRCNARFDDAAGVIYQYQPVHVGIAAQTENGLMVPVLHDAEGLDVWECASEIARLGQAAREGKASRDELSGSTITISSLGALGGIVSTPVINHPEVSIIAINRGVERPMWRDGQVQPRLMMNLSSSFDHRIVDGQDAAQFIQAIRAMLEYPTTIFI